MYKYKSLYMETYIKDLWQSLISLTKLLKQKDINFTVIGGAALNQYSRPRITEDIDILVDLKDKEKLLNIPIGYLKDLSNKRGRVFKLQNPETHIDVIYTGEMSGSRNSHIEYISPDRISTTIKDVPFLTLKALVEYKLATGLYGGIDRLHKDFADVIELIKHNKLKQDYCNTFRSDLKDKYIELYNQLYTNK